MNRFYSRRQKLNQTFLSERLKGVVGYDRIAGYLSATTPNYVVTETPARVQPPA